MYEVELKVRADHDPVRRELERTGATHLGTVRQVDTYYDAPHREFGETDEALRIRRERTGQERTVRLTYKGPLVDERSKTREEVETAVADGDAIADILSGLGFEPAATVEKTRDRFAVGEYTVTLDTVDSLGEFVEIETEAGEDDLEAAREGAAERLAELGLDPAEGIRTSYLGLLLG